MVRKILTEDRIEGAPISELAFKPDFMTRMQNQLTFIEIASLKEGENVDWKTLRLIEHIFEAKLFFGNKSVFTLIALDEKSWKPYCLELLENFSDRLVNSADLQSFGDLYATPKESNFELWNLEREFTRSRSENLQDVVTEVFRYHPYGPKEMEYHVYHRLQDLGLHLTKNYPLRNLKNYYLRRDMNLRFYFDFFAGGKIIETKSFKRIGNLDLQNLMIKSRLIRYEKVDGRIRLVPLDHRMILLVNGSITGPDYDPKRYLRMLTTAGWDVYPIGWIDSPQRARQVFG